MVGKCSGGVESGRNGAVHTPKQGRPQGSRLWGSQVVLGIVSTSPREQEGSGSAGATDMMGQKESGARGALGFQLTICSHIS